MKIKQENLNIFYGYRCNYACEACSSGSNEVSDASLDPNLDEILESIPILAETFEVDSMITLIGGEPFLYWDDRISIIAQEVNRWFPGNRINIFTNGQLLHKNVEKIFALSEKVDNLSITISNHLTDCGEELPVTMWRRNINDFINHPRIVKIHADHYHIKDNIHANIYFSNMTKFKPYYKRLENGTIKPWATNDPKLSMKHGCVGNVCSCTFGKKLYKCPILATLPNHLKSIGQEQDPDWQKYINYPVVDLSNLDPALLEEFSSTYGKPVSVCDMCNGDPINTITKRTYPLVFKQQLHSTFNE